MADRPTPFPTEDTSIEGLGDLIGDQFLDADGNAVDIDLDDVLTVDEDGEAPIDRANRKDTNRKPRSVEEPVSEDDEAEAEDTEPERLDDEADDEESAQEDEEEKSEEQAEDEDEAGELPGSIDELAEAIGLSSEEIMGMDVTFSVDGKPVVANLQSVVNGHMRQQDYTTKTSALAEDRKLFSEATQQAIERWQTQFSHLEAAIVSAEELLSDETDLEQIRESDGFEAYMIAKEQRTARQAKVEELKGEKDRSREQIRAQQAERQGQWRADEHRKLMEHMPELAEEKTGDAFQARMIKVLGQVGYTAEDITNWLEIGFDHRQIRLIALAVKTAAATERKPELRKKLRKLPKVLRPGAQQDASTSGSSRDKNAKKRVRATRGMDDDANAAMFNNWA